MKPIFSHPTVASQWRVREVSRSALERPSENASGTRRIASICRPNSSVRSALGRGPCPRAWETGGHLAHARGASGQPAPDERVNVPDARLEDPVYGAEQTRWLNCSVFVLKKPASVT